MPNLPWAPHRNPDTDLQLETCEFCSAVVPHHRLRELESVAGLRGKKICDLHDFNHDTPTHRDYQADGEPFDGDEPRRLPPISDRKAPWELV